MLKRVTVLFFTVVFLICSVPFCCFYASAKEVKVTPSAITRQEELSYFEYSAQYKSVDFATEQIVLSSNTSIKGGREEYLGETAVSIYDEKVIEWNLTIPEDALYLISIRYSAIENENNQDYRVKLSFDGDIPFSSADNITLKRIWEDDGEILRDSAGNDLTPKVKEVFSWRETLVYDDSGYSFKPCRFFLSKGKHSLCISAEEYPLYISSVSLLPVHETENYDTVLKNYKQQGYDAVDNISLTYQAEKTEYKSSQTIFPIYDRSSAATIPNSPYLIRRNTIGGEYWKNSGDWISYKVKAPKSGLYCLTFKYRQNTQLDMAVYRKIEINGEVPFKEFENVAFPYTTGWENITLSDGKNNPYFVYLNKGENTITLYATTGEWSSVLQSVDTMVDKLNVLYRKIIMVTGTTPDNYRDYYLEREIDDLEKTLSEYSEQLNSMAETFEGINRGKSSQSSTLRTAADQLEEFSYKTANIPKQLLTFRENITALSDWLQSNKFQPLEFDYFMVHSQSTEIPSANGTFWQRLIFSVRRFIAAFSDDYGDTFEATNGDKVIDVWINDGRDQAQLLKDMITDSFTSQYGIGVDIDLVSTGITEAVLAGRAPDVVVGATRGQPVNLASRNALFDLSKFEDFGEITNRFSNDAVLPYTYNDAVYALPMTQYFLMLFYRTDIFDELSLFVPDNWDEFMAVAAYLQRNNLKVGLPYTAISATGAVDLGVGAKDIFPTLLLQNGARYYSDDLKHSELNSNAAVNAFKMWTSFYTDYGFDLSYDFVSLFRSGEMPLAIAGYSMYGMIDAVATEIHGNWEMALMPGTVAENGELNREGSASGSAVIMLKDASEPEACWEFIKWLTDADTQADFGNKIEGLLGVSARYTTANLEAFSRLNWSSKEYDLLTKQRSYIIETPEIPGGYYTSRCVDNAFRNVVYQQKNPRKSLEEQYKILETEIQRKIEELQ